MQKSRATWEHDKLQISFEILRDTRLNYQEVVKAARTKYFSNHCHNPKSLFRTINSNTLDVSPTKGWNMLKRKEQTQWGCILNFSLCSNSGNIYCNVNQSCQHIKYILLGWIIMLEKIRSTGFCILLTGGKEWHHPSCILSKSWLMSQRPPAFRPPPRTWAGGTLWL